MQKLLGEVLILIRAKAKAFFRMHASIFNKPDDGLI